MSISLNNIQKTKLIFRNLMRTLDAMLGLILNQEADVPPKVKLNALRVSFINNSKKNYKYVLILL